MYFAGRAAPTAGLGSAMYAAHRPRSLPGTASAPRLRRGGLPPRQRPPGRV